MSVAPAIQSAPSPVTVLGHGPMAWFSVTVLGHGLRSQVLCTKRQEVRRDYDLAERVYRRALEVDPTDAATLCNYGLLLKNIRKVRSCLSGPMNPRIFRYIQAYSALNPCQLQKYFVVLTAEGWNCRTMTGLSSCTSEPLSASRGTQPHSATMAYFSRVCARCEMLCTVQQAQEGG